MFKSPVVRAYLWLLQGATSDQILNMWDQPKQLCLPKVVVTCQRQFSSITLQSGERLTPQEVIYSTSIIDRSLVTHVELLCVPPCSFLGDPSHTIKKKKQQVGVKNTNKKKKFLNQEHLFDCGEIRGSVQLLKNPQQPLTQKLYFRHVEWTH